MAEPTSGGAAAGIAGWKLIGGTAGVVTAGAGLAAVVVMCMTPPRSTREWVVGIISTVLCSIGLGAFVILRFDLLRTVSGAPFEQALVALAALLGLVFSCGLPGWFLVRALFRAMDRRREKDLAELADEVRQRL